MQDSEILTRIDQLVTEEHRLRQRRQAGELTSAGEQERLRALEIALDQCWDMLRQRRAKRFAGQDPAEAQARSAGAVESYRQ
jgi:Protein of unknown function (DUF2630)